MKRFVKRIVLFALPFLLFAAGIVPFYLALTGTGELGVLEESIEKQRQEHETLLGLGYNEDTCYYKLINAEHYQADVLALGTSRVMQLKDSFFQDSFYNCSGAVSGNYNEYRNFLQNLNYKPKLILLGLDTWVFNDEWNKQVWDYETYREIHSANRSRGAVLKQAIQDWRSKKWAFGDLRNYPQNIGFNGRVKDVGFLFDGSYYYGDIYRQTDAEPERLLADTMNRIENGDNRFEWGEHIDPDTLRQLEALLSYCKENEIEVAAFLTPFAPSIYSEMEACGNYGYMTEIMPACTELFEKYQYEIYDYADGAALGVTDAYFVDGFHGSEVTYAYLLKDMAAKNQSVRDAVDLKKMGELICGRYSEKVFFNPDERHG